MKDKDEKWIKKAQEGSKQAFNKIIQDNIPTIFHLLYDMTGNYEDAQDLAQETFIKAFLKIGQYSSKAKFSTWLYRIAYNVAIDFQRKKKRVSNGNLENLYQKKGHFKNGHLSDKMEYSGENEAIESALSKLTDAQRMAVVLHYYHGFKTREIGEMLGCSEGTARVHLFRAIRHLRKDLRQLSPKENS
jgi:RNA polymerase sigma-70 factor (ECF subfamily)